LKTPQIEVPANEEITATELKALFDGGTDFQLIDVASRLNTEIAEYRRRR
jgi:hypothetical protein